MASSTMAAAERVDLTKEDPGLVANCRQEKGGNHRLT